MTVWLPLLFSVNVVASSAADAVMVYVPLVPLAVKTDDVAVPAAVVVWVHEKACGFDAHAANVALAPLPGAANVTATPETGLP